MHPVGQVAVGGLVFEGTPRADRVLYLCIDSGYIKNGSGGL